MAPRILLGNHRLFEERELCSPSLHARVEAMSAQGRTPVLVARDSEPIGLIGVPISRARTGATPWTCCGSRVSRPSSC